VLVWEAVKSSVSAAAKGKLNTVINMMTARVAAPIAGKFLLSIFDVILGIQSKA
jgi:hypothetical protein